jgi:hypothetical protein
MHGTEVCWLKEGAVWFSETRRGPHCTKVCWNIDAMCNEILGVERGVNRVCGCEDRMKIGLARNPLENELRSSPISHVTLEYWDDVQQQILKLRPLFWMIML